MCDAKGTSLVVEASEVAAASGVEVVMETKVDKWDEVKTSVGLELVSSSSSTVGCLGRNPPKNTKWGKSMKKFVRKTYQQKLRAEKSVLEE
jgi:hypothetical protein